MIGRKQYERPLTAVQKRAKEREQRASDAKAYTRLEQGLTWLFKRSRGYTEKQWLRQDEQDHVDEVVAYYWNNRGQYL